MDSSDAGRTPHTRPWGRSLAAAAGFTIGALAGVMGTEAGFTEGVVKSHLVVTMIGDRAWEGSGVSDFARFGGTYLAVGVGLLGGLIGAAVGWGAVVLGPGLRRRGSEVNRAGDPNGTAGPAPSQPVTEPPPAGPGEPSRGHATTVRRPAA